MKEYWKKFFNLTVLEDRIDRVNDVLKSFGDKIITSDYKVYDVDGEKIAHFSIIIGEDGKKIFRQIVNKINSQL